MKMHMSFDIDYEAKKEADYGFFCSTAYGEGVTVSAGLPYVQ